MPIQSLGWKTEIKIRSLLGKVSKRNGYLVVRTPSNPEFIWGNFLFLPKAPKIGDIPLWRKRFSAEFNGIKHLALSWDVPVSASRLKPFANLGFTLDNCVSLERNQLLPAERSLSVLTIRTLQLKKDWDQIVRNYLESGARQSKERSAFVRNLFRDYQKMSQAGFGRWFGAYLKGRLIASLGIVPCDDIGRFQEVFVHKNFRRRGFAAELIRTACNEALGAMGLKRLVIVADKDSPAEKLYAKLGFKLAGREQGIFLKEITNGIKNNQSSGYQAPTGQRCENEEVIAAQGDHDA